MASAHPLKNTSKSYVCTQCASNSVSVIREDPQGVNPRLKCNSCQFIFNGQDSLAALDAGAIKPSSVESLAEASEPEVERLHERVSQAPEVKGWSVPEVSNVPIRPAYVFLSKPRGVTEFCTKRDFKRTAVKWHDRAYNVYELKAIKLEVRVDLS